MLINLMNAIIRLDLGMASCSVDGKMLSQNKLLIGLSSLTFVYLGLLKSANVTFASEGFEWWGLAMLFVSTALETHFMDIALMTKQQIREQQRIKEEGFKDLGATHYDVKDDFLAAYGVCDAAIAKR